MNTSVINPKLSSKLLNDIEHETPYLVIDLSNVRNKYNTLRKALPDFQVFYAVKSNPERKILETLKAKGSSFEIASIGELDRLIAIGVEPKDVIFSNPVKINSHIQQAHEKGVKFFAFDSPDELQKLKEFAPGCSVYLRISVSNHGSLINLASKFGCNISHAKELMTIAQDFGLDPYGLAFHVGSQSENINLWDEAFEHVNKVIEDLETARIRVKCLNIGGGFPVRYTDKIPTIEEIGYEIAANVAKLPYKMKLWCEPGRYLVAESAVIAGTVIGKATRQNTQWIYLDVGRFQAFIEMFESSGLEYPTYTSIDGKPGSQPLTPYTVTGPTCDSFDTISKVVMLPTNLQIGDRLYFASTGAYTTVYGAPFNDFKVPEALFIDE